MKQVEKKITGLEALLDAEISTANKTYETLLNAAVKTIEISEKTSELEIRADQVVRLALEENIQLSEENSELRQELAQVCWESIIIQTALALQVSKLHQENVKLLKLQDPALVTCDVNRWLIPE
jgi:regulator of replication initiation timing